MYIISTLVFLHYQARSQLQIPLHAGRLLDKINHKSCVFIEVCWLIVDNFYKIFYGTRVHVTSLEHFQLNLTTTQNNRPLSYYFGWLLFFLFTRISLFHGVVDCTHSFVCIGSQVTWRREYSCWIRLVLYLFGFVGKVWLQRKQ